MSKTIAIWSVRIDETSPGFFVGRSLGPLGYEVICKGDGIVQRRMIEAIFAIQTLYDGHELAALSVLASFHPTAQVVCYEPNRFIAWRLIGKRDKLVMESEHGWIDHTRDGTVIGRTNWHHRSPMDDLLHLVNTFDQPGV